VRPTLKTRAAPQRDQAISDLNGSPVARVILEPTGRYHRVFETALAGRFPLVKVNPLQARRFAEPCGARPTFLALGRAPVLPGRGESALPIADSAPHSG